MLLFSTADNQLYHKPRVFIPPERVLNDYIALISQMRKPKHRESKPLAQAQTEREGRSPAENLVQPAPGWREGRHRALWQAREEILQVSEPRESVRLGLGVAERRCSKTERTLASVGPHRSARVAQEARLRCGEALAGPGCGASPRRGSAS